MYQILEKDGQLSEPIHQSVLEQMAADGRLTSNQMLTDPISGKSTNAGELLGQGVRFSVPVVISAPIMASVPQPDSSILGRRFIAQLIDSLCSIPLAVPAMIPGVGMLFTPLYVLYWISHDAFFGGQSIGKRVMNIRVVNVDGSTFVWQNSAKRNILYLIMLAVAIPMAGPAIATPVYGAINFLDIILILTTQKRIGDNFAKTLVVRA